jgi:predicted Zn-dependent peptidase
MNEPEIKLDELVNGTKLLSLNNPNTLSTVLSFYVKVGSCNENIDNNGISHFIEHMLYKGTKKYPNTLAISKILDELGVKFNAYTYKKNTCYYFKFLSNTDILDKICEISHDMLFNSLFRNSDIEKECNVIIEEYNALQNSPPDLFNEIVENIYFNKSSLGKSIIGNPTSLKNISRRDLLEYHKTYYKLDNMVIVIGGNLPKNAVSTISKYFGAFAKSLNPFESVNNIKVQQFINLFTEIPPVVYIPRKMKQNIVSMIFQTAGIYDENRYKLIVMKNLLGDNMSSRLFINIRDKLGLVYSISASLNNYIEGGFFSIDFETDHKNTDNCTKAILDELQDISKHGFIQTEFARSIKNIKSKLIIEMESNENITDFYGEQMFVFPQLLSFEQIIKSIDAVTLQDINHLSSTFFSSYKTIIYGKYK